MNIFSRVSDIINANISDLLDRAEDPEKMVKMLIFEMEEQIQKAREGVTKAIAGEKQLEANLNKNRNAAADWHQKAEIALDRDDETLARQCLARKREHESIADQLQPQWEKARQTSDVLRIDLRRLEEKLEEAIRRRDSLIARQMAAEAQKEVQGVAPAFDKIERSFSKFDRMERRVETMEAEAAAAAAVSSLSRDLDKEYEQAQRAAEVESDLAALKLKKQNRENAGDS
jgi:phage shock protein A